MKKITIAIWQALILSLVLGAGVGQSLAQEEQILARGETHYLRYCAVCHGETGKGGGLLAEYLKILPTDLTQLSKKHQGEFPFWQVYRIIDGREEVKGHGTRNMPIWGEELRISEPKAQPEFVEDLIAGRVWQMILYIRSLQEASAKTP
ncbi:MAG: cytochrome c [Candidatus Binatia bacterium]